MFCYEKISDQAVQYCTNHDQNLSILSMIDTTAQGSFDLSQTKHAEHSGREQRGSENQKGLTSEIKPQKE